MNLSVIIQIQERVLGHFVLMAVWSKLKMVRIFVDNVASYKNP